MSKISAAINVSSDGSQIEAKGLEQGDWLVITGASYEQTAKVIVATHFTGRATRKGSDAVTIGTKGVTGTLVAAVLRNPEDVDKVELVTSLPFTAAFTDKGIMLTTGASPSVPAPTGAKAPRGSVATQKAGRGTRGR